MLERTSDGQLPDFDISSDNDVSCWLGECESVDRGEIEGGLLKLVSNIRLSNGVAEKDTLY